MPCKYKQCPRQTMSEEDLIRHTIKEIEQTQYPAEIVSKMGAMSACAACTQTHIASWLSELLFLRGIRAKYVGEKTSDAL